ncbi:hypothetical protein [Pseudomonas kulmbachensis]|uniref:Uncharacterized protein n=1 Tax=Pseudomonas kulmbachensis TaxID=3043408 RepID=A0ABW7LT70_9PSED
MVLVSVHFDMAIANAATQHPILEAEWIINVLAYKGEGGAGIFSLAMVQKWSRHDED